MNSSGIKRGLAASAVAALAVVGLPLAAHADPVNVQVDPDDNYAITVFSFEAQPFGSVKDDGINSTVTLEAGATKDFGSLEFEYKRSVDPDVPASWKPIGSTGRNDNGSFKVDWAVPNAILDVKVDIRAWGNSTDPGGNPTRLNSPTRAGVTIFAADDPDAESAELTPGEQIGVYQKPGALGGGHWIAINGKTSADTGTGQVGMVDPADGSVPAFSPATPVQGGMFEGAFDIEGAYDYDVSAPIKDEIVLAGGAVGGGGVATYDVETYDLYKQTLASVSAEPADSSLPDTVPARDIVITAKDQEGRPMAGLQIRKGADVVVGTTNGLGQLVVSQDRGTTVTYWGETTGDPGNDPDLGDKSGSATVGQYHAAVDDIVATSKDGAAFDVHEHAAGDLTVQVVDSRDAAFDVNQELKYRWKITPFDGSAPSTTASTSLPAGSDANGKFNIALPPVPAGGATLELLATLVGDGGGNGAIAEKSVLTVKAGDAEVLYQGFEPQSADVNTSASVTGTLVLEDGTPLPGRKLGLTWDNDPGPAGRGDDTVPDSFLDGPASVTTDGSGKFTTKITDVPDGPEKSELGGLLSVASQANGIGNALVNGRSHGVNFVTAVVPAGASVEIDANTAQQTPGMAVTGGLVLEDSEGNPLKGRKVTLTVDRGFFLKINEIPADLQAPDDLLNYALDPDPIAGGQLSWASAGTTITVSTDADGEASWAQVVQRDTGFDDDGKVKQTVTATGGPASDTEDYDWNTIDGGGGLGGDALVISEISVVKTPAVDQSGPTNPAPTDQEVQYDVYAKDGYGNLVKGVTPDVEWAPGGDDHPTPVWGGSSESDFDNGGDLAVTAFEGGAYDFDATLTYGQTVFDDPVVAGLTTQNQELKDSFSQEWYDVVPTNFTLSAPTSSVAVGGTATVKVKVTDQKGNPVQGLEVEFVRTGDPSPWSRNTNSQGESAYVFNRTTAGTETVTAVVRGGDDEILKQLTAKVVFGGKLAIKPVITARSSGSNDLIAVNGPTRVRGAKVVLYKVVGGRNIRLKTLRLNSGGNATFSVKDVNGKSKRTAYRVVVAQTSTTKRFVSGLVRTP